jgi:hypothetical protein
MSIGTFRLAVDNSIPSVGAGDLAVYSPGVVDLNTYNDTVNALIKPLVSFLSKRLGWRW